MIVILIVGAILVIALIAWIDHEAATSPIVPDELNPSFDTLDPQEKMKQFDDKIVVTFTEEDRQQAQRFRSIHGCLLATALIRMGLRGDYLSVGPWVASVGSLWNQYSVEPMADDQFLESDKQATEAPFYRPEVVGKSVTLTRV